MKCKHIKKLSKHNKINSKQNNKISKQIYLIPNKHKIKEKIIVQNNKTISKHISRYHNKCR